MKNSVLIVDDNIDFCKSLSENLQKRFYNTEYALNLSDARQIISKQTIGFVLLDLMLGDENGLELLNYISETGLEIPVIVMTGFSSVETAVEALKRGAKDYIKKPIDLGSLSEVISNHFKKASRRYEYSSSEKILSTRDFRLRKMLSGIEKIAATDIPILITGENGTGKEFVADHIINFSPRVSNKVVKLNCAAFPENLLDNELFGHEKGAYTGADDRYKGVFETADGGTLFLDEIGDMTKGIQAKILRTLQNNEIKRIGGNEIIKVDIRFIAATNKNLEQEIESGRFRQDLYFRLNAATIHLPPLRERSCDIELLCKNFIEQANYSYGKNVVECETDVMKLFEEYSWPGNVRELKNAISFAVAMSSTDKISINDLPNRLGVGEKTEKQFTISANEKEIIIQALQKAYYNKKKAAEILDISRNTLYNKMKKYGIESS